jgi:phosphate/sulfate permease
MISFVVALFTIYKGGKGLGLHKTSPAVAIGISAGVSVLLGLLSYPFVGWWARKCEANMTKQEEAEATSVPSTPGNSEVPCEVAKGDPEAQAEQPEDQQPTTVDEIEVAVKAIEIPQDPKEVARTAQTEQLFTGFVVIIAGFFSLAHGANDVANSVGPFGAVLSAYEGELKKKSEIPIWVFIASGFMIVVGLATYGVHVMKTLGTKITAMTPSRAFCVNFASTIVVLIATRAGIPVSTTHASVGAVLGVGIAQGARSVQWKVLVKVFLSWILTLPIVGVTAMGVFALLLPTVVNTPFK